MQCPRCQQENRPSARFCDGCGTPLQHPAESATPAPSYGDLQRSQAEALDQQTATSEILRAISSAQTDAQPVFDAIVDNASRLCRATLTVVHRFDGELIHLGATRGGLTGSEEYSRVLWPRRLDPETLAGRCITERTVIHIGDIESDPAATPIARATGRARGFRSILLVPMLRDGQAIGSIAVSRAEAGPFSPDEITLLRTFAAQAVIAIENVRLFKELEGKNQALTEAHAQVSEALERQTATSEILRVISRSPTDAQPVFETIVESAARLCNGAISALNSFDGETMRLLAAHNWTSAAFDLYARRVAPSPHRGSIAGRSILDRAVVHVPDIELDREWAYPELSREIGFRSSLSVPMLRDGVPLGVISVSRAEAGPFSDSQITLLQTFADQALIAIENVRLFTELQESNRELTTALDTQTATSDILRVMSHAQTDVRPVFDAILASAVRLLQGYSGVVTLVAGDQLDLAALTRTTDVGDAAVRALYPERLDSQATHVRATRKRAPLNIADAHSDPQLPEVEHTRARVRGYRSHVVVPLLRQDEAIGTIGVTRRDPGGFTDDEIALLQTFADQAVIAIENVRLFNETKEALDQQTATGDILKVIASSPTDIQPVLDAVAESAARLTTTLDVAVFLRDGDGLRLAAHHGPIPVRSTVPLIREEVTGRAVLDGGTVHVADLQSETVEFPGGSENARRLGLRTVLSVPLVREGGSALGTINLRRAEVLLFTERQVALLQTFADQAVIAIENVRLFTELQASNRELTTALDTQTATSDILRVISRSQTDVQPVFDAILDSAVRLLQANTGAVTRIAGDQIELAAFTSTDDTSDAAVRATYPMSLRSERPIAQAVRDRAPVNIADAHTDPRVPEAVRAIARVRGYQSRVAVPLLRHDEAVGAISVTRREPGGFTDDEIALLKTFADQAVIAIENARLLSELQARTAELTRSVDELTALGDVGRVLSSTLDLETVLQTIVTRANQLTGTAGCTIWEYDEPRAEFRLRASHYADEGDAALLQAPGRATTIPKGQGVTTRVMERRQPVQIHDIAAEGAYESPIRRPLVEAGHRALLGVPLLREDQVIGVLAVTRKSPGAFEPETVQLLTTFATQSALAIQNARLFREIEDKSRQLEVASQHKSEFLANMSHELRTPLNAIIGFSEVLTDRMFGELNEKQEEYLKDIYASGTHLLSLINDILDLSKIEAGRMELELTDFHLPTALDNALTLVRERAGRRSIALQMSVDERLGEVRADERKIRQVVLNLLSNAIKFTPEGGRIEVAAVPKDGSVEVSVSDTGVGIALEDQEAVFEEFRQVGTADKKVEGTGLGLTLCRKFVELHGGKIWVTSQVGVGSTFTFTIPMRVRNESNAE
jgi:GAF domain-containing protein